jgi:CHAD domain-containing protein
MLSRKKQVAYFKKRTDKIIHHLKAYCKTRSKESLHQLRVETKRVSALARLSDATSKRSRVKDELKGMKEIFHHAAIIRNAHLNLELTSGVTSNSFREKEKAVQHREWLKLRSHKKENIRTLKHLRKEGAKDLHRIKKKDDKKWFKDQLSGAHKELSSGVANLHNARKILKRLIYMNDLHKAPLHLNQPYLTDLEKVIGDWHDVKLVIPTLKRKHAYNKKAAQRLELKQKELKFTIDRFAQDFRIKARA